MVDLFALNEFIRFFKKEYPEIDISAKYDPSNFELTIRLYYANIDYHCTVIRRFVTDTKEAIGAICFYHTDFLAELSKKGVKLNGR